MRSAVHQALRDGTSLAHDRVDAAFADFDLTDRASYARFLAAHADVVWPLEATLPGDRVVANWADRKRGHLLREDLAQLPRQSVRPELVEGRASASGAPDGEEPFDKLRANGDLSAIAGTLYVLEGSRLGGKFLARRLPAGFPRAYLDADQRAENWQQLLGVIDRLLREPDALAAALAAALATFAAFEHSAANWRRDEIGEGR
ncbi:biliverdin-producing heme oxygenase [Sphingomonas sp. HITSZ_GF]|uniref:biliverdin-producing heme oxygenase n=1 Tax=Sphingomonas sp. HITSZ_GF TaxID=3037247 RepID=UPI00240D9E84|nr:biliverdin-producing heme oxygenase [Sphingomonas sp. HITSZ_GF]MDG2535403.1 biliverdin-producing heme oxygenase [Sphingomonas sp. HITSZ_GF]